MNGENLVWRKSQNYRLLLRRLKEKSQRVSELHRRTRVNRFVVFVNAAFARGIWEFLMGRISNGATAQKRRKEEKIEFIIAAHTQIANIVSVKCARVCILYIYKHLKGKRNERYTCSCSCSSWRGNCMQRRWSERM